MSLRRLRAIFEKFYTAASPRADVNEVPDMKVWIRRLRSLFAAPPPLAPPAAPDAPPPQTLPGEHGVPVRASAPPITDLDLLRALGCDV